MKKKEKRKLELLEQQARQLQEMDAGDGEAAGASGDAPVSKVRSLASSGRLLVASLFVRLYP